MRAVITAMSLSLLAVEPALACVLVFDPAGPPGETYEEFATRQIIFRDGLQREKQRSLWQSSEVVFLARVTSHRYSSASRTDVSLRPIATIHGSALLPSTVLTSFDPALNSDCGPTDYPRVGELAVVYADRPSWRVSPRQWSQPRVHTVRAIYQIRDRQVAVALRNTAARLRASEH